MVANIYTNKVGNMRYINNLPVIMSALSAIITGLYGYLKGLPNSTVYKYMCICTIAFYLLGLLIKRTIVKTIDEINKEKEHSIDTNELLYLTNEHSDSEEELSDSETSSNDYSTNVGRADGDGDVDGNPANGGRDAGNERYADGDGNPADGGRFDGDGYGDGYGDGTPANGGRDAGNERYADGDEQ